MPTLMAGINQTIMLSLSMVVIASMIGAQGIGAEVYRAVTHRKLVKGLKLAWLSSFWRLSLTALHKIYLKRKRGA